jgi:hypothetical protein
MKMESNTGELVGCEGESFMNLFSTVMEEMEAVLSKGVSYLAGYALPSGLWCDRPLFSAASHESKILQKDENVGNLAATFCCKSKKAP